MKDNNNLVWHYYRDKMPEAVRERYHYNGDSTKHFYGDIVRSYLIKEQSYYHPDSQWAYRDEDEKPQDCPRCGTVSKTEIAEGATRVIRARKLCPYFACGLRGPLAPTEAEATKLWNRIRIEDDDQVVANRPRNALLDRVRDQD